MNALTLWHPDHQQHQHPEWPISKETLRALLVIINRIAKQFTETERKFNLALWSHPTLHRLVWI